MSKRRGRRGIAWTGHLIDALLFALGVIWLLRLIMRRLNDRLYL